MFQLPRGGDVVNSDSKADVSATEGPAPMTEEVEMENECAHHWMIDSPNGPTSEGVCKLCGVHGEFRNSMQGSGWDRESAHNRRVRQARS
jgi:hypothetical protein